MQFFVLYFTSSRLILSSHFLIPYISSLTSLVHVSFRKFLQLIRIPYFFYTFKDFKASTCFIPWSSIAFICSSNALSSGEYVNLACSIILLWSDGNISTPVGYSYLPILLDYNADIFAASLLMSYCNFSFLILSSIIIISFYIPSKRFFLNRKRLTDARITAVTKKIWFCSTFFHKDS